MNKRITTLFVFAITVALTASTLVYKMLQQRLSAGATTQPGMIVAAARDLPPGTLIRDSDLTSTSARSSAEHGLMNKQDVIGRGVLAQIYAGEPIVEARLTSKGSGGGLAGIIPAGKRAAAVRVNEVVGVSGFVRPGMHVDVITSGVPPGNIGQSTVGVVAKTVLQDLEVLSAGQDLDRDADGKPLPVQVVNLLVTPEQAEILSLASTEAKVQLVLRNPLDRQIAKTPGTTIASIFSGSSAPPVAAPAPVRFRTIPAQVPGAVPVPVPAATPPQPVPVMVEVVNGSKKESVTVGYVSLPAQQGTAQ